MRQKMCQIVCLYIYILQIPAKLKTTSSSAPCENLSEKDQPVSWSTKIYPIRSRFREACIMVSMDLFYKFTDLVYTTVSSLHLSVYATVLATLAVRYSR